MAIIRSYAESISAQETFNLGIERTDTKVLMASASVVDRQAHVDVSWLPAAAEIYNISPDIRDYVVNEVPIIEAGVPNRNKHCFELNRLLAFNHQHGRCCYQTWIGKPTHVEHQHEDEKKAKGVIVDSSIRTVNGRTFVFLLQLWDRTKDPQLAAAILSGKKNMFSMSATCPDFTCSCHGLKWDTQYTNAPDCVRGRPHERVQDRLVNAGKIINGALTYMLVSPQAVGIESSQVDDPAAIVAESVYADSMGS